MMGYEIASVEGNWIYIKHSLRDELGGFITLIKSIADEIGGRIIQMDGDDVQYMIMQDKRNLVYRWDTSYGLAVIVPEGENVDSVLQMLNHHLDKLNS